MPRLFTTKTGSGHGHLFFVPDGQDMAYGTDHEGHSHEITVVGDTFFIGRSIYPEGYEGEEEEHDHEGQEIVQKIRDALPKEDDEIKVKDVQELFKAAFQNNSESYKNAIQSEEFRAGKQWEDTDKKVLEGANRACLTINESGAQIDSLLGYQRNNRSDFKHRPIEGGDAKVGQIADEIIKNICEQNGFVFEESRVSEDQYVAGLGNFNVNIDFDDNIEGDIVVERMSWRDVLYGPYEKLDGSDCEYLVKQKMYSKERLKTMFPEKAEDIQKNYDHWYDYKDKKTISGMEYSEATGTIFLADNEMPKLDIAKKEYRLIECWRRHYREEYILIDLRSGGIENITGVSKAIRKQFEKRAEEFKVVRRVVYDMRVTKIAGDVLLSDEISDLPPKFGFDVIPVHAKFQNGKWWGKMEEMKDLQREVNHRRSQLVDIINKSVSYMWMIDDDTFNNPADEQEFKDHATTPGFVGKVADVGRPPLKIEGGKVPVEVIQLEQLSKDSLYRIANIPMESQGDSKMELSGAAIREKTQVALQANRYLFDNMNMAKKIMAKKIMALVQKYYTPERIIRLIRNNRPEAEMAQQPEALNMDDQAIMELLENNDLMELDLVVDTSPYSPTIRMGNQILLQEMIKQGAPIPFPYFIQQSDLPDKENLLAMFNQQQQAQAEDAEKTRQTEIQKTLIAKGGMPPQGGPA
jgi:hypothetical protein